MTSRQSEKVLNLSTDALKTNDASINQDRKRPRKRVEDPKRFKQEEIQPHFESTVSRVTDASFGATIESGIVHRIIPSGYEAGWMTRHIILRFKY